MVVLIVTRPCYTGSWPWRLFGLRTNGGWGTQLLFGLGPQAQSVFHPPAGLPTWNGTATGRYKRQRPRPPSAPRPRRRRASAMSARQRRDGACQHGQHQPVLRRPLHPGAFGDGCRKDGSAFLKEPFACRLTAPARPASPAARSRPASAAWRHPAPARPCRGTPC